MKYEYIFFCQKVAITDALTMALISQIKLFSGPEPILYLYIPTLFSGVMKSV